MCSMTCVSSQLCNEAVQLEMVKGYGMRANGRDMDSTRSSSTTSPSLRLRYNLIESRFTVAKPTSVDRNAYYMYMLAS